MHGPAGIALGLRRVSRGVALNGFGQLPMVFSCGYHFPRTILLPAGWRSYLSGWESSWPFVKWANWIVEALKNPGQRGGQE